MTVRPFVPYPDKRLKTVAAPVEAITDEIRAIWDDMDEVGRSVTEAAEGNTVTKASAEDIAAFQAITDEITASVLAEIDALGVDATAAYEQIKGDLNK